MLLSKRQTKLAAQKAKVKKVKGKPVDKSAIEREGAVERETERKGKNRMGAAQK